MANFFYAKSGYGTRAASADTPFTSIQTGAFSGLTAGDVYASIADAESASKTNPPVSGEFIIISHLHAETATSYLGIAAAGSEPSIVLAVSDTAIDAVATTRPVLTTGTDVTTNGSITFNNVEFAIADDFTPGNSGDNVAFHGCKLAFSGSNSAIQLGSDGRYAEFRDTEIAFNHTGATMNIAAAGKVSMYGGSVTTSTAGVTNLIAGSAVNGGALGEFVGVDLTGISSTGTLVNGMGANGGTDDVIDFLFDRCRLTSGTVLLGEALTCYNHRVLMMRSGSVSADAEHQYELQTFSGSVLDDTTIRRADDEPFTDSGTDISYKMTTNANCGQGSPLWFDFPTPDWSALSAGATDVLRLFVASTTALNTSDVWAEVVYPDGTTKQLANFVSTRGFPLSSTALTTDSASDWRDGAGAFSGNEYQIDADTSGDAGADCYPTVRIYCSKPSVTLYIASEFLPRA